MIPKIIHYCWFGGKPLPELAQKCIESWKKYLPEYELRLWNEETFNLDMCPYTREAYDNRKYAFVTDVVRLWALEKFGGVYMDTDVEILRPLGDLMELPAFTGYEASMANAPVTGLMASAPHGVWVKEQLAYYEGKHFVNQDGTLDLTPNTVPIANIMKAGGFVNNGKYQVYKNDMHVFPVDYFCPLTSTRVLKLTKNSYCIHHFAGSWVEKTRGQIIKEWIVEHIVGRKLTDKIVQLKRKIRGKRVVSDLQGAASSDGEEVRGKSMRIVQIGPYPLSSECIHGGVEASVYGLAQELAKHYTMDVFDVPRIGEKDRVERCGNISVYRYANPCRYNQHAVLRLSEMVDDIAAIQPDVCHIHGTGAISKKIYFALRQYNIPIIVTVHGLLREEKKQALLRKPSLKALYQYIVQSRGEQELLEATPQIIVDTAYVEDKLRTYGLRHMPEIHVIPQGIDEAYFGIQCNPNSNILLSVGAIGPRKGHIYTVEMFNLLRAKGIDAKLRIIGSLADKEYYEQLKQKIAVSPYKTDISLGVNLPREELMKAYAGAKLFVLHSREESQGIVFAEAMATGLPVVATKIGGIPYVVEDGKSGLLCTYGDVGEMAKMVSRILTNELTWQAFSSAARQKAKDYNWTSIADRIVGLYGEGWK